MRTQDREFDTLHPSLMRRRVSLESMSQTNLAKIYPSVVRSIPVSHASLQTVERMRLRNPESQWAVFSPVGRVAIGLYLMLFLTSAGRDALLSHGFSAVDPVEDHVARPEDSYAAVFKWYVYVPNYAAAVVPTLSQRLSAPRYKHLDLFANGTTESGRRLMRKMGFVAAPAPEHPNLYRYTRLANRTEIFS